MADTMSAARAMWTMFEPVHDVTYFAPEALRAFTDAGLRGYWRGYFAALAVAGIDGCEAVVLRCAKDISRDLMQPVRGWTDEQWGAAAARLAGRGWIGEDATLTAAGRAVHDAVEAATDQAAERPWNRMGAAGLAEVADVLLPLALACAAALPEVTPVGRLQPTRPDRIGAHQGQLHDLQGNPAEQSAGGARAAAARSGSRERTTAARETGTETPIVRRH